MVILYKVIKSYLAYLQGYTNFRIKLSKRF